MSQKMPEKLNIFSLKIHKSSEIKKKPKPFQIKVLNIKD